MDRNSKIDICKGIGIILVILGHMVQYGSLLSRFIFAFHMPLFFFLSGYVFHTDYSKSDFKYKVLNLLLPYLFFSILSIVISLLVPSWRVFTLKSLFLEYFYEVNPNSFHIGQIWFLFALLDIVILIFINHYLFENETCILAISLICFMIAYLIKSYGIGIYFDYKCYRFPLKWDDAFAGFLFFYAGFYMNKKEILIKIEVLKDLYKILIILVSLSIFIISTYLNGMVNLDCNYNNPILYLLSAFSGIFFTYFISSFFSRIKLQIFNYLGKNTLSIFAIHSYPIILFCYILSKIKGTTMIMMDNLSLSESLIGSVFVIIFCLLFTIPYNRYVRYFFSKLNKRVKNGN